MIYLLKNKELNPSEASNVSVISLGGCDDTGKSGGKVDWI